MLDGRVDGGLAAHDPLKRVPDLPGAGVFGEVTASTGAQGVDDGAVVGVGGEHEYFDAGVVVEEAAGGLDAVAAGHPQVHQHDVWPLLDRERQRLVAVGRGADHLDPGHQGEQGGESFPDHALVVSHQDADGLVHPGTHSSTQNPAAVGAAVRVPPSSSARSFMPVSP